MKKSLIKKCFVLILILGLNILIVGCGTTNSEVPDVESSESTEDTTVALGKTEYLEENTADKAESVESETESTEVTKLEGAKTETPSYTYSDMDASMYATDAVDVKTIPSTDGTRLGSLSRNQEVKVTGKCNETGWYRIVYNSDTAYVSNSYLSTEKQAETKSVPSGNTTTNSNSNATTTATQQEAYFDRDKAVAVFNMVNAERAANGLNQLTWDESIYNFACSRAQTLVNDFSHGGCGSYGENIQAYSRVISADELHSRWYNSSAHHSNYLNSSYTAGAVAVYVENGTIYAVENFYMPGVTSPNGSESTWTASNGVVITVVGGDPCAATADVDAAEAAINEWYACH